MKNYNVMALRGYDLDDAEFISEHNETFPNYPINPALANTPALNDAKLEAIYNWNIEMSMQKGMSRQQAEKRAGSLRVSAAVALKDLQK